MWVNLATDTAGDIPLGFEPKVGDELKKPPRRPGTGLVYPGLLLRVAAIAILVGTGSFMIFRWAEPRMSIEAAKTMTRNTDLHVGRRPELYEALRMS